MDDARRLDLIAVPLGRVLGTALAVFGAVMAVMLFLMMETLQVDTIQTLLLLAASFVGTGIVLWVSAALRQRWLVEVGGGD